MDDFIEVYDDALDGGLCDRIVEAFERSGRKVRGQTGHGVDTAKKDSYDLNISTDPDWAELHEQVLDAALRHLLRYALKYQQPEARPHGDRPGRVHAPTRGTSRSRRTSGFSRRG